MGITYFELRNPSRTPEGPTNTLGPITLWTARDIRVGFETGTVTCNRADTLGFDNGRLPYAGLYWSELVVLSGSQQFSVHANQEHALATPEAARAFFNRLKNEFPFTRRNTLRYQAIKTMLYAGLTDDIIREELSSLPPASATGHQYPLKISTWLATAQRELEELNGAG